MFRADLSDDITRAEQAAIKGLAIYLSQKYLSQALNEDLEAMCSRFAIQMNEHHVVKMFEIILQGDECLEERC